MNKCLFLLHITMHGAICPNHVTYVLKGGCGKQGVVLDIRGWDNESGRSVANIAWDSGSTNVYRLGHKGKIDLKYLQDASGGFYYREHLLKLGKAALCP